MFSSSKCGVLFSDKVEKDAVAWGAEQPIYSVGIMADWKPGNLWINRTIKESLIILENKHSPVPKRIVQRVYRPDVSWEKAFHTVIVFGTAEEILKK